MALRILVFGALLISGFLPIRSEPSGGNLVRGKDFQGVIFTPKMILKDPDNLESSLSDPHGFWTPSSALILKAEAALPDAIAEKTKYPMPTRGLNYPLNYTAKNGSNLNFSDKPVPPPIFDSEYEENFLYDAASFVRTENRQYIGVTLKGKKFLLLSFVPPASAYGDDSYLKNWKEKWIRVLDGGDNFWTVLYDPVTGAFSNWECNGYG